MTIDKQGAPMKHHVSQRPIEMSICRSVRNFFARPRKRFVFLVFCFFVAVVAWLSREHLRLHYWWRLLDDRHLRHVYRRAADVEAVPIGVLVNVSGCVIPEFNPFDESLAALLDFAAEARFCRGDGTRVVVDGNVISINFSAIKADTKLTRCVITPLRYKRAAPTFNDSDKLPPTILVSYQKRKGEQVAPPSSRKDIYLLPHERRAVDAQFARVICWRRNFFGVETQDFVNFVPVGFRDQEKAAKKEAAEKRLARKVQNKDRKESQPPRFSVHLIGIDSTSRHNSVRYLPKTRRFLEDLGAIEFFGYNKVGDNTLANVIPALTGLSIEEANRASMSKWPFIWQEFENAGFWTLFGEDWDGRLKTFNKWPENLAPDHHFLPFGLEMDRNGFSTYLRDCYGDQLVGEKVYEWYLQVLKTHSRHRQIKGEGTSFNKTFPFYRDRMFSMIWTNDWSHEELNLLKRADDPTLLLLKEMEKMKIFEDDVVLFFSDHGLRFGRILETQIGLHELSMPVFFISFPPWFHKHFGSFVRNLRINARRLTTPYDLNKTLRHLLRLQGKVAAEKPAAWRHPLWPQEGKSRRTYSLFQEVPEIRTCADAGIPQQYCSCGQTLTLSLNDPEMLAAAEIIVQKLNEATRKFEHLCIRLKLKEIKRSYRKQTADGVTMLTTVSTTPGDGVFEMSVSKSTGRWRVDTKEVNRLDRYGLESACLPLSERLLRKICFCYNQGGNAATALLARSPPP